MSSVTQTPFSSRNRGDQPRIDNDFPDTARVGLKHLLHDLVRKQYVQGWVELARELQRIARIDPTDYDSYDSGIAIRQAQTDSEEAVAQMPWDKVYDFCERLHSHLAREVGESDYHGYNVSTSRGDVQTFIASELQSLFLEEGLAFEFRDGMVQRRGRRYTVQRVSRAEVVLGDPDLLHSPKTLREGATVLPSSRQSRLRELC